MKANVLFPALRLKSKNFAQNDTLISQGPFEILELIGRWRFSGSSKCLLARRIGLFALGNREYNRRQSPKRVKIEAMMPENDDLHLLCHGVVVKLTAKYGWRLLAEDEFVRIVSRRATVEGVSKKESSEGKRKVVFKIALNEYALTLYRALSVEEGQANSDRYSQAIEDLHRYLFEAARQKRRDSRQDAEDATQEAIMHIERAIQNNEIRKPAAFLAFSLERLRGAFTAIDRKKRIGGRPVEALDELTVPDQEGDTSDNWESRQLTKPSVSVEAEAEERLLQQALLDELRRKFQIHPDAANQLRAVILKHAFEHTNQKIADILQAPSPGAVSTLIYRGIKKLQGNQALETLYGQWFELQMGD